MQQNTFCKRGRGPSQIIMSITVLLYDVTVTYCLQWFPEVNTSKDSIITQLLLNPQYLVVLCQPFTPARGPCLDLPSAEAHNKIPDEGVLSLPGPVGHHDPPSGCLG